MHAPFARTGLFFAIALLSIHTALARPRLHIIHTPSSSRDPQLLDVSADGRIVAGIAFLRDTDITRAFRSVGRNRVKEIPMNLPVESYVSNLSADGSVLLGDTHNAGNMPQPFLWTEETGALDFFPDPDVAAYSSCLSGNGQVVAGIYLLPTPREQPFLWSAEKGLHSLSISNFEGGIPTAIDHDGSVTVGILTTISADFERTNYACRWVQTGEPQLLDPLGRASYPSAITPDGSVIICLVREPDGISRPFRWTHSAGMEMIPTDHSFLETYIAGVAADGRRMVGSAATTNFIFIPVLWTADKGAQDLNEAFRSTLPRGWSFTAPAAISPDGRWIACNAVDPHERMRCVVLDTGEPEETSVTQRERRVR